MQNSTSFIRAFAFLLLFPLFSHAATFTVNNNGTDSDATPGDGVCEVTVSSGDCSLVAATEEANALTGAHTINFAPAVTTIVPFATYDLTGADITIQGPGRASLTMLATDLGTLENDSISGVTIVHGPGQTILGDNASLLNSEIHIPARSGDSILLKSAVGTATIDSSELIGSVSSTPMITVTGGGSLNITASTLRDHSSGTNGGAIFSDGTITITDSEFSGNAGLEGGAIFSSNPSTGPTTITNSTFVNNIATSIIVVNTGLSISGSQFNNNQSNYILTGSQGGVTSAWTVSESDFSDNLSGGINYSGAGLTLSRSSITGNETGQRAMIEIGSSGTHFITNTVVSDNQMNHNASTIAHIHSTNSNPYIFNSTISHNVNLGTGQSGISTLSGSRLSNNIIANNTNASGPSNCSFNVNGTSGEYNFIDTIDTCLPLTLTITNLWGFVATPLDPMLGPLTTDTTTGLRYRAPLPGSPVIDLGAVATGCNAQVTGLIQSIPVDLLGNTRSIDGNIDGIIACDAGAIEFQPDSTPAAFAFTDQTDVALSTLITSDVITISDIELPSDISITNGEYRINTGAFTSSDSVVNNGDTIDVRHTSSATNSASTDSVLTIGGVSDTFTSTTIAVSDETEETNSSGGGGSLGLLVFLLALPLLRRRYVN